MLDRLWREFIDAYTLAERRMMASTSDALICAAADFADGIFTSAAEAVEVLSERADFVDWQPEGDDWEEDILFTAERALSECLESRFRLSTRGGLPDLPDLTDGGVYVLSHIGAEPYQGDVETTGIVPGDPLNADVGGGTLVRYSGGRTEVLSAAEEILTYDDVIARLASAVDTESPWECLRLLRSADYYDDGEFLEVLALRAFPEEGTAAVDLVVFYAIDPLDIARRATAVWTDRIDDTADGKVIVVHRGTAMRVDTDVQDDSDPDRDPDWTAFDLPAGVPVEDLPGGLWSVDVSQDGRLTITPAKV